MKGDDLQNGMIDFNMTNEKDNAKLKKLSKMKLPKFGAIRFREVIKEDMKSINLLLGYSIANKLSRFSLKGKFILKIFMIS